MDSCGSSADTLSGARPVTGCATSPPGRSSSCPCSIHGSRCLAACTGAMVPGLVARECPARPPLLTFVTRPRTPCEERRVVDC